MASLQKMPSRNADATPGPAAGTRPRSDQRCSVGSSPGSGSLACWLAEVLLFGLITALNACSVDAPEPPPSGGFASSPCADCTVSQCRTEILECQQLPSCAGYLSCLGSCPTSAKGEADASCEKLCAQYAGGVAAAAIDALAKCRTAGPGLLCTSCGRSPPPLSGDALFNQVCPASALTDECDRCWAEQCCKSDEVCKADPDCSAIQKCVDSGCQSGPTFAYCVSKCMLQSPKGIVPLSLRGACRDALCSKPCSVKRKQPEDLCSACMARECPDILIANYSNAECLLAGACSIACDPANCSCDAAQCRQTNNCPSILPCLLSSEIVLSCQRSRCASSCLR